MTTPYQTQDHIYTQATGTTANEVPAPSYNEKPPPAAHQPSYHQDPQVMYTHPSGTTSPVVGTPGVYHDPSQQQQQYHQNQAQQQQYQQAPVPIQPEVHHQQQQQQQAPPPDFYQQQKQQQYQQQQQQQPIQQPLVAPVGVAPVPLDRLQRYPDIATCPACGRSERTRVEFVSGGMTHLMALAACFVFCLGCIPYLISSLKDCEHYCGNCGAILAVWHRSGHTEVLGGRGGPAPVRKPVAAPVAGGPPPAAKPNHG